MPQPRTGSFRLAEQIGAWAVFADISITLVTRGPGIALVRIEDNIHLDDEREFAAISFGVSYALGYVPNFDALGVVVNKLHTNPVDTTPMALAFASCHAVLNCLDTTPANAPYFDRITRSFVFPGRGPVN